MDSLSDTPRFETTEEIDCPGCGEPIPMRSRICPHCEFGLH